MWGRPVDVKLCQQDFVVGTRPNGIFCVSKFMNTTNGCGIRRMEAHLSEFSGSNTGFISRKKKKKWIKLSSTGVCAWLVRRVLDWMTAFIEPYIFTIRDYRQYSATAILHTSSSVRHALRLSVFPSRIPATDFTTVSLSLQLTHEVFLAQSNLLQWLLYHLGLPSQELDPVLILAAWVPRYIASRGAPRRTPSFIVKQRVCISVV
jgi:hypothetical protein